MNEHARKRLEGSVRKAFMESIRAKEAVRATQMGRMLEMAELVSEAFRERRKLFLFGNGGSAADAQHIAAEFVNRFQIDRPPLPAIALTVDASILTSISNDFRFDEIFARQLEALARPGDVALGISTSGRSNNVTRALKWARLHEVRTIGWAGAAETEMDECCEIIVHVPSPVTARVQECHITVGHVLCQLVEELLFSDLEEPAE